MEMEMVNDEGKLTIEDHLSPVARVGRVRPDLLVHILEQ